MWKHRCLCVAHALCPHPTVSSSLWGQGLFCPFSGLGFVTVISLVSWYSWELDKKLSEGRGCETVEGEGNCPLEDT